jgi:hypothetical protein
LSYDSNFEDFQTKGELSDNKITFSRSLNLMEPELLPALPALYWIRRGAQLSLECSYYARTPTETNDYRGLLDRMTCQFGTPRCPRYRLNSTAFARIGGNIDLNKCCCQFSRSDADDTSKGPGLCELLVNGLLETIMMYTWQSNWRREWELWWFESLRRKPTFECYPRNKPFRKNNILLAK